MTLSSGSHFPRRDVCGMIEALTIANAAPIIVPSRYGSQTVIFSVETNFQRMARRPGGISRQQALSNAQKALRRFFP